MKLIDPWEGPTVKQVQAQLQVLTEVIQDFVTNGESTDMHLDFSGDTTTIVQHKELMSLDSGNLC